MAGMARCKLGDKVEGDWFDCETAMNYEILGVGKKVKVAARGDREEEDAWS